MCMAEASTKPSLTWVFSRTRSKSPVMLMNSRFFLVLNQRYSVWAFIDAPSVADHPASRERSGFSVVSSQLRARPGATAGARTCPAPAARRRGMRPARCRPQPHFQRRSTTPAETTAHQDPVLGGDTLVGGGALGAEQMSAPVRAALFSSIRAVDLGPRG